MTLSALSLASPFHRPMIIRLEGEDLIDVDDRWPEHWDILLIDGGVRTRHIVVDNREIDDVITRYTDNGYEVLGYPPTTELPYVPLDREVRIVEQVPAIVAHYLDAASDTAKVGEVYGEVYFDRGTLSIIIDKAVLADLIGLERGEMFLVSFDHDLRVSIVPSDPLDGLVHHAEQPEDFTNSLRFSRKTRPGEWLPELTFRTIRFDVFEDRSLASDPVLQDVLSQPVPRRLNLTERVSLMAPAAGDFALLPLVLLLGALG